MEAHNRGIEVEPEALRSHAGVCHRSGERLRKVRASLEYPSMIQADAWDGGGMSALLALQGALDRTRHAYDRVREGILARVTETAGELHDAGRKLRNAADTYQETDVAALAELPRWP